MKALLADDRDSSATSSGPTRDDARDRTRVNGLIESPCFKNATDEGER